MQLSGLCARPAPSCAVTRCMPSAASRRRRPLAVRAVAEDVESTASKDAKSNVCQTCGAALDKAPRGCDRLGRIVGGIGGIPGFDWWPVKAYRPCPALAEAGLTYTRKGQIVDEMLFGKPKQRKQ